MNRKSGRFAHAPAGDYDGMSTNRLTARDIQTSVRHWLHTPPNGYLGSRYGSPIADMLQSPMASGLADSIIDKAREDVPMLQALRPGAVNIYTYDQDIDTKVFVFEVGDQMIDLNRGDSFKAHLPRTPVRQANDIELLGGLTEEYAEKLHQLLHVTMSSRGYF